jgi:exopolysaccharide production protein ExoF
MLMSRLYAVLLLFLLVTRPGYSVAAEGDAYILAPLDKLRITIVEWKPDLGESRDWSSINGEYDIDAEGTISVPFIGTLEATGRTTEELATTVSGNLRTNLGLSGFPQASVSIAEYRPVFITGQIQNPGKYPYFPGMNVVKLVSVAGGVVRSETSENDITTTLIRTKGSYDELADERVALLAKTARLNAELANETSIEFPATITGHPDFKTIASGEQTIKEAREARLQRQLIALEELKKLLNAQLVSLDQKSETLKVQEEFARQEMEGVSVLKEKGLTINSRLRTAHQFLSQTQANRLTTENDILRVKQELNQAERDGASLLHDLHAEVAQELQETNRQLRLVEIRIAFTRDLMSNNLATASSQMLQGTSEFETVYTISRDRDGKTDQVLATEDLAVKPGDVVKVEIRPVTSTVSSN